MDRRRLHREQKARYPADCFRKAFSLNGKVRSARLYITACGLYSAALNGVRVSMPLAPGITDYRKRVQYQTYDVTALLRESNALEIMLADGWYRGSCGAWGLRNQYGTETKLLAQLVITYEDGKKETVATDETWQWSNDGPIRFADNKDGEIVDARMQPSFSGRAKVTAHSVTPTASNNVPVAEKETFKGKMTVTPGGRKLFDFGQNIAGYVSFSVNAKAGQTVTIRCGELLENGELTLKNIQLSNKKKTTPLQKIEYVCRDGVNDYKTTFAVFGFQYAEIETDAALGEADVTAVAVYSDLEETGTFKSSNELLNRFVDATRWSAKNNSADLPTDCPTRERHGWLGDAQIFVKTASYLFNYLPFARKFENDVCDAQHKNGCFTQIAPVGGVDFYMNAMDGSAGWSDAGVFIPYRLYLQYGDADMLRDYYDRMRRYTEYKLKTLGKWYPTAVPTGISPKYARRISNYGQSYGEWAEPA
ncbi:MAG: family 78 glycoside hydrolase catalytic domain, partial [Clostridia bacterium]|nr:family 78 glycoside hydrolase catalytic domain [Clostridia bacterium]